MKILISNDDGYQAPGIVALHDALHTIADVEVVAPENNNSFSVSVVFPASGWEMMANVRRRRTSD